MQGSPGNAIIGNLPRLTASLTSHDPESYQTSMQNDSPNTERYIAIARACLKAINDTAANSGSRGEKIQAVYQAIDKAFQAEFSEYRQSVAIMATVLERIASGELDADKAASLARKTLDQQPAGTQSGIMH